MLRELQGAAAPDTNAIGAVQTRIRKCLPTRDTGGALPHKKTPSGRTKVLHMHYTHGQRGQSADTERAYLKFFSQTVMELGLHLEILTDQGSQDALKQELIEAGDNGLDYTLLASQNPPSKWAEDSVEYLDNGQVTVLTPFDDELLIWAMTEGRRQRWHGLIADEFLDAALQEDDQWIPLGVRVNTLKTGVERSHVTRAEGQRVGHLRAYIEGGNLITGEDATGRFMVLVGRDAIAATARLYQLNEEAVRQIICEDFGLTRLDQIVGVEQPGHFHLDMGLLFLGHGIVVVNDSQLALKDAFEMAEMVPCLTTKTMAAKLQLKTALEAAAVRDLVAAGLEVRRERLEHEVEYNFLNGEFVEGEDGFLYYLTNGGPQDAMAHFQSLMVDNWQVVKKVIFSPPAIAQKSLQERGGLGCRLKGSTR
ncbi:MAG: hypothetical protein AAF959_17125 [Cyanobacteria bacterium P01_D01_bin.56]